MEHGGLKILCVSVDLDMRTDRQSVLVSVHKTQYVAVSNTPIQHVYLVSIVPVRILPASHVLPTLRWLRRLPLSVSVCVGTSETT